MTDQTPRGYSGMDAPTVIAQSAICHPEWTAEQHRTYLVSEEGFEESFVVDLDVEWLLQENAAI